MLKNDIIYYLLFKLRNIDLNNINDTYFAINIIVIIATTLFETLIAVIFVFKLVIIIIVIVIEIFIIVIFIVIFKEFIFKFIAFDFNIKRRLIISASFNKS